MSVQSIYQCVVCTDQCENIPHDGVIEPWFTLGGLRAIHYKCLENIWDTYCHVEGMQNIIAELAALKELTQSVCRWRMEDDDSGLWAGDCGAMWTLTGGSPEENEMAYCPQCGRKLEQVEPESPELDA